MKTLLCTLAVTLLSLPLSRGDAPPAPDAKALAYGYAAAFETMNKSSVAILYLNAGQVEVIKDVNQITAFGAVLLVKSYSSGKQILDAARVVKITDKES